jgi:hypothetical protein
MDDTIPNLWPEQFRINVQTPLTILRIQAQYLGKVTRGILQGVVETETAKDRVQHRLVVVAPALTSRHTLIRAIHSAQWPYPAEVQAEGLKKPDHAGLASSISLAGLQERVYPTANDDDEMQQLLRKAFGSESTRALISSLLAQCNELFAASQTKNGSNENFVDSGV